MLGPMVFLAVLIPLLVVCCVGRAFLQAARPALDSSEARPVEFATPSRISEASYMLVSPPAELGTYAAAIELLPDDIVASVAASAPCPQAPSGRHYWHSEVTEIEKFGVRGPVRRDEHRRCGYCTLAIDADLYRDIAGYGGFDTRREQREDHDLVCGCSDRQCRKEWAM